MGIIDCFIFNNELDLLEVRLKILDSIVDKFVLVEADKTFTGEDKPLHFLENHERYERWNGKIVHVIVRDLFKDAPEPWVNENFQRACVIRGLGNAGKDDLIMVSDLDEIPNPDIFPLSLDRPVALEQRFFYYNLDCEKRFPWFGTVIVPFSWFELHTAQELRDKRESWPRIANGGWHCSYFGNLEFIISKIKGFAHQEFNKEQFLDPTTIEELIQNRRDLFGRFGEDMIESNHQGIHPVLLNTFS